MVYFIGGAGVTGSAMIVTNESYLLNQIEIIDPSINNNTLPLELTDKDIIVFNVNIPNKPDGSQDWDVLTEYINDCCYSCKLFIIRSTVSKLFFETLDKTARSNIVYIPEFLNEVTSNNDFKESTNTIIGATNPIKANQASMFFKTFFDYTGSFYYCSLEEAADFKYLRNMKQAWDLMFYENIHDCGINARKMADMFKLMPTNPIKNIGIDGFRGYGGKCLPKDIDSFNHYNNDKCSSFLKTYNHELSLGN